jgi:FHA domain
VTFKDELTIGRAWRADDPALQDTKMSHRHARSSLDEDRSARVEDLGSMNGTYVNGKRIEKRTRLSLGDQVKHGTERGRSATFAAASAIFDGRPPRQSSIPGHELPVDDDCEVPPALRVCVEL